MSLRNRLIEVIGAAIPERLWPGVEPHEDDPPVVEADHTGDDPGPEHVERPELRPLEG
jgi:hypothetical protein